MGTSDTRDSQINNSAHYNFFSFCKPLCESTVFYWNSSVSIFGLFSSVVHSPSKCLAWVKKCCHIWLDQNFDPSLLTNKLWLIFMGKKQKNFFFLKKKIQNGRLKKSAFFKIANSQNFFVKILWIGPWVSRLMRRAAMWLNLYGHEAVRHKL